MAELESDTANQEEPLSFKEGNKITRLKFQYGHLGTSVEDTGGSMELNKEIGAYCTNLGVN